nr:MAG TPA: hypothetical protein [Caudoviricetes sp.]
MCEIDYLCVNITNTTIISYFKYSHMDYQTIKKSKIIL